MIVPTPEGQFTKNYTTDPFADFFKCGLGMDK